MTQISPIFTSLLKKKVIGLFLTRNAKTRSGLRLLIHCMLRSSNMCDMLTGFREPTDVDGSLWVVIGRCDISRPDRLSTDEAVSSEDSMSGTCGRGGIQHHQLSLQSSSVLFVRRPLSVRETPPNHKRKSDSLPFSLLSVVSRPGRLVSPDVVSVSQALPGGNLPGASSKIIQVWTPIRH